MRPSHKTIYKPRWSLFFNENRGEFATANALNKTVQRENILTKRDELEYRRGTKDEMSLLLEVV